MHLDPHGEHAVLVAASLANDWPASRDDLVERTRGLGMTMTASLPTRPGDLDRTRQVVDATTDGERSEMLNA